MKRSGVYMWAASMRRSPVAELAVGQRGARFEATYRQQAIDGPRPRHRIARFRSVHLTGANARTLVLQLYVDDTAILAEPVEWFRLRDLLDVAAAAWLPRMRDGSTVRIVIGGAVESVAYMVRETVE